MERDSTAETTEIISARVLAARERAAARLASTPWRVNAEVPGHELRTRWQLAPGALNDAAHQLERGLLTARGLDRVLRVAWTVADLAGRDRPDQRDVRTALVLRTGGEHGLPLTERAFGRFKNIPAQRSAPGEGPSGRGEAARDQYSANEDGDA
jgi:magnesium chelatase family protein